MKIRMPLFMAAVVGAAAAGALAASLLFLLTSRPPAIATTSGTADIGGPFTLVSTRGGTVTDRTYLGKWLVLFFGYTSCPDVCPTTLNNISIAMETLGADASRFQPTFVTVDPKRDTRAIMAEYLKSFDSRIVGLTGTQAQIDRIVKEYHVYVSRQKAEDHGDDQVVAHNAYIYLMDPQGKFADVIQGTESGEKIATWLRKETTRS